MPASLRKCGELKSLLIPSLVQLLTEVEEDEQVWAETNEENNVGMTDPFNTGVNGINTISNSLGEKTIMPLCSPMIKTLQQSQNWKERQAGYMLMGLIAEACKDSMKKNMGEAMQMSCAGMIDPNMRVRYAGLSCTALILTELSPKAQKAFHSELVPMLVKMMGSESILKMKTHSVSTMINFVRGFVNEEEDEEHNESNSGTKIMSMYSSDLFLALIALLKEGIS